jgi:quercetin dioxygenase-like cupin family protein
MALLASEGVSVGFAHCVPAVADVPDVPTQAVIAIIAASAANERVIFSITKSVFTWERRGEARKTSPLFEIALVLVRLDHVASFIINANHRGYFEDLTLLVAWRPRSLDSQGRRKKLIMKKLISILGISILAVVVAKAQDPAKVDPEHYKVLLDNQYVRVLDVHHKPGEKSPMHSHPNHVVYSFTDSTVKFTSSGGKTDTRMAKAGQVVWRNAETHSAENIGENEEHALDIELKK